MQTKDGDALARGALALAAALSLTLACKKSEKAEPSAAASAPTKPASGASADQLTGFDECLVGKWRAERVSLAIDPVNAEGGQNVMLYVEPSGACSIDFTPMSEIHATAKGGLSFDFKYSGKASGTLKTPQRGALRSEGTSFGDLRVSATAKLPGAGSVPLFKETPVKELAAMGTAMAGAVPKPANAPAVSPTQGIDANPVFSSSGYTCQGEMLSLSNIDGAARWTFRRAP